MTCYRTTLVVSVWENKKNKALRYRHLHSPRPDNWMNALKDRDHKVFVIDVERGGDKE